MNPLSQTADPLAHAQTPVSGFAGLPVDGIRNLQAITSPGVGGREIVPVMLARELQTCGQPTWLWCQPNTLTARLGKDWQVPVVSRNMQGYFDPAAILTLSGFLRHHRIQIIHAHWSHDLSNLLLAASLAGGIPVVLTKHVYSTQIKRDPFHSWIYHRTKAVIAVSGLVAENLLQTTNLTPEKITTIYPGLDLDDVWNPKKSYPDLRSGWGIPPGAPILGYAGRLNAGKGPQLILDAFIDLAADFPEWHLVFIGRAVGEQEEAYAEKLRTKTATCGYGARIHFPGFCADMPAAMQTFEVLICASQFESLGMVLVEAMAMAKPVIGPDAGGVLEIINPGVTGECFHHPEVKDLTVKLKSLLVSPERRTAFGRAGRQTALEKFNLKKTAQAYLQVYQRIKKK